MVLNHCDHGDDGGSCYAACFAALESREQDQRCIMHIMHIMHIVRSHLWLVWFPNPLAAGSQMGTMSSARAAQKARKHWPGFKDRLNGWK